jgi:hypothetical protein
MFSARMRRLRQSLAFRLTLWYAGVFTLSSLAAFIVLSLSLASIPPTSGKAPASR